MMLCYHHSVLIMKEEKKRACAKSKNEIKKEARNEAIHRRLIFCFNRMKKKERIKKKRKAGRQDIDLDR